MTPRKTPNIYRRKIVRDVRSAPFCIYQVLVALLWLPDFRGAQAPPGVGVFEKREGAGGLNARDRHTNIEVLASQATLSVRITTIPTAI